MKPPQLPLRFFRWFCHPKLRDSIEGDLMELYEERVREKGKRKADWRLVWDVLLLFRRDIIRPAEGHQNLNTYGMYKSYFKSGWRNILKNKGYSFINLSGLAIGLAAAILILLWVRNETSYDSFYPKASRIYQLFSRDHNNGKIDVWGNTPALMAEELKQSYQEVEDAVRYRGVFFLLKVGENRFNDAGAFADPGFLSMFSMPMLQGNSSALENEFGIVLTKNMAIKLFGKTDCLGETVVVNENDNFKVTGVLEDRPSNSSIEFGYLLPWKYVTRLGWDRGQTWAHTYATTYVLLKEKASPANFDSKITGIIKGHISEGDGLTREVLSHPLTKVHLYSKTENGKFTRGRIETVRLFSVIASLIILIACINFMNLSTARSEKRAREVGVRKVAGAGKSSLIAQFISESMVMVMIAFLFAMAIVQLSMGWFNEMTGTSLSLPLNDPKLWLYAASLVFVTGLLAGSYPAFYLSSSQTLSVLKGTFKNQHALVTPRKVLVVTQFTFAIMLSICAVMVQKQIQFAQDRDAGYEKRNLAYNFMQGEIPAHFESIKNELIASGAVTSVTRTFSPITRIWDTATGFTWQGSDESDKRTSFLVYGSDEDLTTTFGIKIKDGRDLDIKSFSSDTSAVLLNETAVAMMRLKEPVGAVIKDYNGSQWHVVGVVKDFIIESPYDPVSPMIINGWRDRYGVVNFKLNPAHETTDNLTKMETVFKKYNAEYPFEYFFVEEFYDRKFANEKQTGKLSATFAVLTIFISCLGLFGLSAYMAQTKTKEIGIRKVLGASTVSITALLSRDFVGLVIVSILLSAPLSWLIMSNWLLSFNYRVPISAWWFLNAAILSIFIALVTVSFQSIKAAIANPVNSLRSE
jgi:putative ABC transport system permease protein